LALVTAGCAEPSGPRAERPEATTTTVALPDGQEVLDQLRTRTGAPGALAAVVRAGEEHFFSSGAADLGGAVLDGAIVEEPLLSEMLQPTPQPGGTYGLGVVSFHLRCGTYLGHAGAIAGTHAIALAAQEGDDAVVVAVNVRTGTDPNLLATAEALLCGSP
jgi:hypothetical protein